ncbi:uncharacterized protein FOKN1_2937 [Thiohalobacter thiocyanaticus]|uniref:GxxExxY protein n=1 Tax=Thiohalobacter thiocyanaticus TaxID=585455 RepID=A0A1Z4VVQ3_9GAMM|nr:GxxExxY protein [Thiohalobacter thiocyanaticus]BAZ95294.1 uncharacterized protein FOKN1_2937 [Thiohalobacter thiocyanaticus]
MLENQVAGAAIGAAIEVHRALGSGLLESAYSECLAHELRLQGIGFETEVPIAINYKGLVLDRACRADFLVENCLVLELKSIEKVEEVHKAQLLTYLRLMNRKLGLLLNFRVPVIKQGVYRVVNSL